MTIMLITTYQKTGNSTPPIERHYWHLQSEHHYWFTQITAKAYEVLFNRYTRNSFKYSMLPCTYPAKNMTRADIVFHF